MDKKNRLIEIYQDLNQAMSKLSQLNLDIELIENQKNDIMKKIQSLEIEKYNLIIRPNDEIY